MGINAGVIEFLQEIFEVEIEHGPVFSRSVSQHRNLLEVQQLLNSGNGDVGLAGLGCANDAALATAHDGNFGGGW
jgi:hypothetical protein